MAAQPNPVQPPPTKPVPTPRDVLVRIKAVMEWSNHSDSADLWDTVSALLEDNLEPGECGGWMYYHTRDDCGHTKCRKP